MINKLTAISNVFWLYVHLSLWAIKRDQNLFKYHQPFWDLPYFNTSTPWDSIWCAIVFPFKHQSHSIDVSKGFTREIIFQYSNNCIHRQKKLKDHFFGCTENSQLGYIIVNPVFLQIILLSHAISFKPKDLCTATKKKYPILKFLNIIKYFTFCQIISKKLQVSNIDWFVSFLIFRKQFCDAIDEKR